MDQFEIRSASSSRSNRRINLRTKLLLGSTGAIAFLMLIVVLVNFTIQSRKLKPGMEHLEISMTQPLSGNSCEVDYCATKPCIITASRILDLMDKNINPCNDFYLYACGNYKKRRALRFNEKSYTPIVEASDNVLIALKKILETSVTDEDSELQKKAKLFYGSCANITRRHLDSVDDVKYLLEDVDLAWPVLDDSWNSSTVDWHDIVTKLEERGVHSLFKIDSKVSEYNPLGNVQVDCTIPTLPKEMYQISEEKDRLPYMTSMYKDFIDSVLKLLGVERPKIKDFVEEILNVEKHLARSMEDTAGSARPTEKPSRELFRMLLGHEADLDEILPTSDSVCQGSVNEFMNILGREPRRAILNYLGWRAVINVLPYLGAPFKNLHDFYVGKFSDSVQIYRSAWRECSALVRDELGLVAYKVYLDAGHFNESHENEVKDAATELRGSFASLLSRITWLDNATRSVFFNKLKHVKLNIGYPEDLRHSNTLDQVFRELDLSEDGGHFRNVMKVKMFTWRLFHSHNHQDGNHSNHGHLFNRKPLDTHSAYEYDKNTIDINLGLLRTPLMHFGLNFPRYLKYAQAIYLAHELSHAFDITGNMYNANGEFEGTGWWPDTVRQNFHAFVGCLINQQTVGTPSRLSQGDGNNYQLINDDIADLGALFITYTGLTNYIRSYGEEEKPLPGLSLTRKQTYYVQAAQTFCELTEYKSVPNPQDGGHHRTRKQRLNAAISNMEDFGAVFNCPAESPMHPLTKCNLLN